MESSSGLKNNHNIRTLQNKLRTLDVDRDQAADIVRGKALDGIVHGGLLADGVIDLHVARLLPRILGRQVLLDGGREGSGAGQSRSGDGCGGCRGKGGRSSCHRRGGGGGRSGQGAAEDGGGGAAEHDCLLLIIFLNILCYDDEILQAIAPVSFQVKMT